MIEVFPWRSRGSFAVWIRFPVLAVDGQIEFRPIREYRTFRDDRLSVPATDLRLAAIDFLVEVPTPVSRRAAGLISVRRMRSKLKKIYFYFFLLKKNIKYSIIQNCTQILLNAPSWILWKLLVHYYFWLLFTTLYIFPSSFPHFPPLCITWRVLTID